MNSTAVRYESLEVNGMNIAYREAGSASSPKLQVLLWPNLGTNFMGESYQQFGKGYLLDTTLVSWFWENYVSGKGDYNDYHVCPVMATLNTAAHPRSYLQ